MKKLIERFREIDIYPVTCEELSGGRSDKEILYSVIEGGAKIIQLRDKVSSKKKLFEKAEIFRRITLENNVLLIVNDHVDIAIALDADGVHLGQDDFPLLNARALMPDKIIGVSTHNIEEAVAAEKAGADYINIGPVFSTGTKSRVTPIGRQAVKSISSEISIPFTVMGGIKLDNLKQVLDTGARKIAVVTAITEADNVTETVRNFRKRIVEERL